MVLLILLVLAVFVVQTILPGRFREPSPEGGNGQLKENLGNRDHVRPLTVVEPLHVAGLGEAEAVMPWGLRSVVKLRSRPRATPASLLATTR